MQEGAKVTAMFYGDGTWNPGIVSMPIN